MPAMTPGNVNRFRSFVHGFVSYKLRENGIHLNGFDEDSNPSKAALRLRRVTNELISANEALFSNMCDRLTLTQATTYSTFVGIADELFQAGNNWGRIVAFFAFGATLSVYCAQREDLAQLVENLVDWLSTYMDQHLGTWFDENGGWDGFVKFFQGKSDVEVANNGGWGLAAAAGLGIGAFLMLVCK